MEVSTIIDYSGKVRNRTCKLLPYIPEDKLNWSYQPGKFTIGDLLRHIAVVERYMYVECLCNRPSLYKHQDSSLATSLMEIQAFMERLHAESVQVIRTFSDQALLEKCTTPTGTNISRWKWILLMLEHEIHHRGQLYLYLNLLDIKTPPMYDVTAEELAHLGTGK